MIVLFLDFFFIQAEDGIRDGHVSGVQTCALPIKRRAGGDDEHPTRCPGRCSARPAPVLAASAMDRRAHRPRRLPPRPAASAQSGDQSAQRGDRKSTRLNSSHVAISYAVFCLKKKKMINRSTVYNC